MKLRVGARKALFSAAFIFLVSQARADTFDWAYSLTASPPEPQDPQLFVNASGVLTTTNKEVNGALLVTGISGSRTTNWYGFPTGTYLNPPQTDEIVSLVPAGVIPGLAPDNLVYPDGSSVIDHFGIGYQLNCTYCGSMGAGGIVQVANDFGTYFERGESGLSQASGSFTLTPVPVPEPAPVTLFSVMGFAAILYWCLIASKARTARSLNSESI